MTPEALKVLQKSDPVMKRLIKEIGPLDFEARTKRSPFESLVQAVAQGERPSVHVEGDVLLAAEIAWVVDHVVWDVEADLARLVGDEAAHTLGAVARRALDALRGLVGRAPPGGGVS